MKRPLKSCYIKRTNVSARKSAALMREVFPDLIGVALGSPGGAIARLLEDAIALHVFDSSVNRDLSNVQVVAITGNVVKSRKTGGNDNLCNESY